MYQLALECTPGVASRTCEAVATAACASRPPPEPPGTGAGTVACAPLTADVAPVSLAEALASGFPAEGRLVVAASITYQSSCPPCPDGARCTPCPPADVALHDPRGGRGLLAYAGTPLPEHTPLALELIENPLDRPTVVACRRLTP